MTVLSAAQPPSISGGAALEQTARRLHDLRGSQSI
jgi:hypothetical protein